MENRERTNEESIELKDEVIKEVTEEVTTEVTEDEINAIIEEIKEDISLKEESDEVSEKTSEEDSGDVPEETSETDLKEFLESETLVKEFAEDKSEDEKAIEETASTEVLAENTLPEKKNRKGLWKKIAIVVAAVLALLVIAYVGVGMYYSDCFLMGTTINETDCAGMTVKEVESYMQSQVEEYVLTITGKNDTVEKINGVDIGIKYNGAKEIKTAFEKQNSYLWIQSLFEPDAFEVKIDFDYDQAKLDEAIANLDCLKPENQVAPVSAIPVYANGTYEIQEEVHGTQINVEALNTAIYDCVDKIVEDLNLEETNCYVLPTYTKDSAEVIAARDELNKCLSAEVTYSLDNIVVTVNGSMIAPWLSVDAATMTVNIDATQVRAFTDTLGGKYNTPNKSAQITTPTGKVTEVPNAHLGRVVGSAAECEQLISEIRAGEKKTREPILSQQATPEGTGSWGTTYIEVDITEQHMWYIVNGTVAFECDVITGSPGRDTPVGSFTILEKLRNKVLRGNIMPNGKREYETPVSYWARVTWSGIGFHDATWQPAFGGQMYKEGYGSHGCINMAKSDVAAFYGMINVGDPVIIHY